MINSPTTRATRIPAVVARATGAPDVSLKASRRIGDPHVSYRLSGTAWIRYPVGGSVLSEAATFSMISLFLPSIAVWTGKPVRDCSALSGVPASIPRAGKQIKQK